MFQFGIGRLGKSEVHTSYLLRNGKRPIRDWNLLVGITSIQPLSKLVELMAYLSSSRDRT
jgi:hypothetical protein